MSLSGGGEQDLRGGLLTVHKLTFSLSQASGDGVCIFEEKGTLCPVDVSLHQGFRGQEHRASRSPKLASRCERPVLSVSCPVFQCFHACSVIDLTEYGGFQDSGVMLVTHLITINLIKP